MNNCVLLLRVEKDRADAEGEEVTDGDGADVRCATTPNVDAPLGAKACAVLTRASTSKATSDCMVILMVMFRVTRSGVVPVTIAVLLVHDK
jgi:hypothetical protein